MHQDYDQCHSLLYSRTHLEQKSVAMKTLWDDWSCSALSVIIVFESCVKNVRLSLRYLLVHRQFSLLAIQFDHLIQLLQVLSTSCWGDYFDLQMEEELCSEEETLKVMTLSSLEVTIVRSSSLQMKDLRRAGGTPKVRILNSLTLNSEQMEVLHWQAKTSKVRILILLQMEGLPRAGGTSKVRISSS